jgi:hypothetical protein
MPSLADLFLAGKGFGLFGFPVLIVGFGWFRGLTCDFWAENAKTNAKTKAKATFSRFALRASLRPSAER